MNWSKTLEIIAVLVENAPSFVTTATQMAAWITKGVEQVKEAYGNKDPGIDEIRQIIMKIRQRSEEIQSID